MCMYMWWWQVKYTWWKATASSSPGIRVTMATTENQRDVHISACLTLCPLFHFHPLPPFNSLKHIYLNIPILSFFYLSSSTLTPSPQLETFITLFTIYLSPSGFFYFLLPFLYFFFFFTILFRIFLWSFLPFLFNYPFFFFFFLNYIKWNFHLFKYSINFFLFVI